MEEGWEGSISPGTVVWCGLWTNVDLFSHLEMGGGTYLAVFLSGRVVGGQSRMEERAGDGTWWRSERDRVHERAGRQANRSNGRWGVRSDVFHSSWDGMSVSLGGGTYHPTDFPFSPPTLGGTIIERLPGLNVRLRRGLSVFSVVLSWWDLRGGIEGSWRRGTNRKMFETFTQTYV